MIPFFWLLAQAAMSAASAVGGAIASGTSALGGALASGTSALSGALGGGALGSAGAKAVMGTGGLGKLNAISAAGQKIIGGLGSVKGVTDVAGGAISSVPEAVNAGSSAVGALDTLKQGAGELLGDGGGLAGTELNAVNKEAARIGTDIKYGAMKAQPGFQLDPPGQNGLQFDSQQGPDMGWEKWRDSRPQKGLGEKMGRSFGELQRLKGNPIGALNTMGNMKEIWSNKPAPDYLPPGARGALDNTSSPPPSFLGGMFRAATEENLSGYFDHMAEGKLSRRKEVLRDYYKSVLQNGA